MHVAALITWLVAAGLGATMMGIWIARGGARAGASPGTTVTRLAPGLVFGHFLLAAAGLIVWIVYLVAGGAVLAWLALALLVLVAVLGEVMVLRWFRGRHAGTVESRFPVPVVYSHGIFAVATAVLVLLSALGVGSG